MPTVGWIYEDSLDAFYSGTLSTPDPGPPPAPRYPCPFCLASFENNAELGHHLTSSHHGDRPFISFNGMEPSSEDIIRRVMDVGSVGVLNTTSAYVSQNGTEFKNCLPSTIPALIKTSTCERLWIRLENQFDCNAAPIRTEYDLGFRIYSTDQLRQVDELFISMLGRADPSVLDVDKFMQAAAKIGAMEYSSAMGEYVIGVLLKDGDPTTGIRLGTHDHRRKLNGALRILQSYERALPQLIASLIKFSSNNFSAVHRTGFESLDFANACFLPLLELAVSDLNSPIKEIQSKSPRQNVCPVDNGSDSVMRRAYQLSDIARWSTGIEESLRADVGNSGCDPLDRVKLSALWATAALRLGKAGAAMEPLQILVGNDCFGDWAERQLEEVST